jgi:hypothetical protein
MASVKALTALLAVVAALLGSAQATNICPASTAVSGDPFVYPELSCNGGNWQVDSTETVVFPFFGKEVPVQLGFESKTSCVDCAGAANGFTNILAINQQRFALSLQLTYSISPTPPKISGIPGSGSLSKSFDGVTPAPPCKCPDSAPTQLLFDCQGTDQVVNGNLNSFTLTLFGTTYTVTGTITGTRSATYQICGKEGTGCPPGQVCDDPHVTGFDGTSIEFNGVPGSSFAFVSDSTVQINNELSTFDMSESTFIRAVGIKHATSNTTVTVASPYTTCKDGPGANATDPLIVTINGQVVDVTKGAVISSKGRTTVQHYTATPDEGVVQVSKLDKANTVAVKIDVGSWSVMVERDVAGCHLNMALTMTRPLNPKQCGGILCETLQWHEDPSLPKMLKGDEMSYMVDDLLGHNFEYSHYGKAETSTRRMLVATPTKFEPLTAYYRRGV